MEQQNQNLPASTNNQSIALTEQVQLFKTLFDINQIVAFPLADIQIEDWAASLKRLAPNRTEDELRLVLDKFMTGRAKWDVKQGIQNLFRGFELLKLEKGEYMDAEKGMKYREYGMIEHGTYRKIYENEKEF